MSKKKRKTTDRAGGEGPGGERASGGPATPRRAADREEAGPFAYGGLDRVLHEKARLGIMTCLFTHPNGLLFNELKELCSLTDGNLSRHLQILNEAKFVEIWKGYQGKRPQTLCRLTTEGRARFTEYVEELGRVVSAVSSFASPKEASGRDASGLLADGWVPA